MNVRFEPEQEAQINTVLLELRTIPAANIIAETKVTIVELKVCIARAEDILRTQLQEIQKITALAQVAAPITK